MKIGEVFRYSRPYNPAPEVVDGFPNYFNLTHLTGHNLPLLDKGINPIHTVETPDGTRRPAILISSSPHKIGSFENPWQDTFNVDYGHIRYFGDNKSPEVNPTETQGNKALITVFKNHSSPHKDVRRNATPLIFFKRVRRKGRAKGFVQFQGFGIVRRVELITQYDRKHERAFSNYAFDFAVLSMANESELFEWDWINARRNPALTSGESNLLAPNSWKGWVTSGNSGIDNYLRRVSKLMTTSANEQRPRSGSSEAKALQDIYNYYKTRRHRFELLAATITERVIGESGRYHTGWITPSSSDGGADFIGRLNIGSKFSIAKLVVLGQAKCEKPDNPTGGNHIARTVARLKRGWLGVYVTTSYFSESVQREVIDDKYPIVLINGLRLAEEVLKIVYGEGYATVRSFLEILDTMYEDKVQLRKPEEVLLD